MSQSYPPQPGQPMGPVHYAPPPPKKKRTGLIVVLVIVVVLLVLLGGCVAFLANVASQVSPTTTTAVESTEAGADATSSADDGASEAPSGQPAGEPTEEQPADEPYKLTVTECKRGKFGTFDVSVKIENRTDDEVTYLFDIGLYDTDDNTVGTGFGSIEVRPGKSGKTTTFATLSDEGYKGKVKCRVEVTNF